VKAVTATRLGWRARTWWRRRSQAARRPRPPYRKAGDAELLARIRSLVDAGASYGYRRMTPLLNRQAEAAGLARVNHKRAYRLMAPHTGRGRQRPHDGEVATAASNRRWATDMFEIRAGTATRSGSRSRLTPMIARSSPGPPAPRDRRHRRARF
jgi:hypothetical protein